MQYINTPLNYTGSKFKLLEQLLPEFDYTKNNFYDLFAGGGSVFTNVVDKYEKLYINDIIEDLVKIHINIIYDTNNFIQKVKFLSPNKENQEEYLKLRESYNKEKSAEKLYALILSCNNNMMRFNNSYFFNQTFGKRSYNSSTEQKITDFVQHIYQYKDNLNFTYKNFKDINIKNNSMVYIDSPYGYCIESNEITSNQISYAGYNCYWKKQDDINLYNYIKELNENKHSFVMSNVWKHNNKTSWICEKLINDGFEYKELEFNYNKVAKNKNDKETIEIIIKNF